MLAMVAGWEPGGPTPLAARSSDLIGTSRRAGVIVVVSDFLTPDWGGAGDRLTARREQLVAVGITSTADDAPDLAGEIALIDSESAERVDVDLSPRVLDELRSRRADRRHEIERRVARRGGRFTPVADDDDLLSSVLPALLGAGIVR
jgi:hypothetical protein